MHIPVQGDTKLKACALVLCMFVIKLQINGVDPPAPRPCNASSSSPHVKIYHLSLINAGRQQSLFSGEGGWNGSGISG